MNVHIVSKDGCPYCVEAKEWMKKNNVEYTEQIINDLTERKQFYKSIGLEKGTVPQIFVDGKRIGGYTELLNSDFAKNIETRFDDEF